ncbi:MAG: hypothetical protein AAF806_31200 [Bacteroidota bacterium]
MTYEQFQTNLQQNELPANLPEALQVLWYDAKGNWEAAHDIAQEMHNDIGSWLHAYLHRKEGDHWNANYWYQRAGRTFPECSLEEEWEVMAIKICAE